MPGLAALSHWLDVSAVDPDDARRRKLLNLLLAGAAGITVLVLIASTGLLLAGAKWADLWLLFAASLAFLLFSGVVLVLNRRGPGWLAGLVFLLFMVASFTFGDTPAEVVAGRTLFLFTAPIIIASVLLRPWASFAFAGICAAVITTLAVATTPAALSTLPTSIGLFLFLALISWLAARNLDQTLRQLRQALSHNERLLTVIPSILIGTDTYDCVTRWNATAEGVFHQKSAQILGRPLLESQLGWDKETIEAGLQHCRTAAEVVRIDALPFIRPDGQTGILGLTLTPIIDKVNHTAGILILGADITERKRAEDEIRRLNAELEQRVEMRTTELRQANLELAHAAHAKDEFLATMSHELRSPLNAILLTTETLGEGVYGDLTSPQLLSLRAITESGHHLLALINDVLDVAKVEAGRMDLALAPTAVAEVCQSALRLVKETSLKKRLSLTTEFDTQVEVIKADQRRLKQILVNLLSNAVKFTPEGGQIGLTVRGDAAAGIVHFTVWDSGVGIGPEDLERLFKPFVQLDNGLAREHTGTGLGLSLVRGMVELHGGSVSVQSVLNRGSRFTVSLPWVPIAIPAEHPSPAERPASAEASLASRASLSQGQLILVAEDSEVALPPLIAYLQAHGYRVEVARNGQEAIDMALEKYPDLILMDVQMPKLDGLEATRQLRARPEMAQVPIIALTALAMPGDRERCLAAGANDYFTKPVSLAQLTVTMNALMAGPGADPAG